MLRFLTTILGIFLTAQPVNAEVKPTVTYSEAADLYSTMDNLSGWLEGFTWPEYRDEWQKRFGWSSKDQEWADRYTAFRRRTFIDESGSSDPRTMPDGIFASRGENSEGTDPLAAYFLAQPNIETAIRNLDNAFSPPDAEMLRGFYQHFEPGWRTLLAESVPLKDRAAELSERLDGPTVSAFIDRVNAFYRSDVGGPFYIFFTRHPPGNGSSAEPLAGKYMLLHAPTSENDTRYWDTIVIHELVHYVSSRQPQEQKLELTKRFLDRCPLPPQIKRLWLLEEPVAVAWGQAAYSAKVLGKPLDPNDHWYAIPWVDIVSRTIAPSIIEGYDTDLQIEDVVEQAADRCNDLNAVAQQLNTSPKTKGIK